MKIVFISNYFTHHQKPFSDEMYKLTDGNYTFMATSQMTQDRIALGWGEIQTPLYVKNVSITDGSNLKAAIDEINRADAVIQGSLFDELIQERLKLGKLTFRYTERLYKSFKRYLKLPLHAYRGLTQKNMYILCASAYTAYDYSKTRSYLGRTYKWGYFPENRCYNPSELVKSKNKKSILWAGRLIEFKHPEMMIGLATKLLNKGLDFDIRIIGEGHLYDSLLQKISSLGLSDHVHLLGSMTPEQVRSHMEESLIFISTSDRNEGWGAVINEAMNSGCAVVASHAIGSVPYLIKNNINGMVFRDGDISNMYDCVESLLLDTAKAEVFGIEAYKTINQDWNAHHASCSLLQLISFLSGNGGEVPSDGPCSIAEIMKDNWIYC